MLIASSAIGFLILLPDAIFPSPAHSFTPWCQRSEENARQCRGYFMGELQRQRDRMERQQEREWERIERMGESCTTTFFGNTATTRCY